MSNWRQSLSFEHVFSVYTRGVILNQLIFNENNLMFKAGTVVVIAMNILTKNHLLKRRPKVKKKPGAKKRIQKTYG